MNLDRPPNPYTYQLGADTECNLGDMLEAIKDQDGQLERERERERESSLCNNPHLNIMIKMIGHKNHFYSFEIYICILSVALLVNLK